MKGNDRLYKPNFEFEWPMTHDLDPETPIQSQEFSNGLKYVLGALLHHKLGQLGWRMVPGMDEMDELNGQLSSPLKIHGKKHRFPAIVSWNPFHCIPFSISLQSQVAIMGDLWVTIPWPRNMVQSYDATNGPFDCGDAVQIRDGIVHAGETRWWFGFVHSYGPKYLRKPHLWKV